MSSATAREQDIHVMLDTLYENRDNVYKILEGTPNTVIGLMKIGHNFGKISEYEIRPCPNASYPEQDLHVVIDDVMLTAMDDEEDVEQLLFDEILDDDDRSLAIIPVNDDGIIIYGMVILLNEGEFTHEETDDIAKLFRDQSFHSLSTGFDNSNSANVVKMVNSLGDIESNITMLSDTTEQLIQEDEITVLSFRGE